jgi:ABC-type Fe3+/spermidine/putrescine transport system ATPase subunit
MDKIEALTVSDRIGVMQDGRLVRVGTARDIYARPRNRLVADFVGTSNFIRGVMGDPSDGTATIETRGGSLLRATPPEQEPTGAVTAAVRPEKIHLLGAGDGEADRFGTREEARTYLDDPALSRVRLPPWDEPLTPHRNPTGNVLPAGTTIAIGWRPKAAARLGE